MRFIKRIEDYGTFFEEQRVGHRVMQHDMGTNPVKCKLCKMLDHLRLESSSTRFFAPIRDRLPFARKQIGVKFCSTKERNWS